MPSATENILSKIRDALSGLRTEESVLKKLHRNTKATLARLEKLNTGFNAKLKEAYGYAVFPMIGQAAVLAGAAYGTGEVFEDGGLIGYAAVLQLKLGIQLGGDTFSQVILFHNRQALDRLKQGKLAFSANAAAALVKGGARTANDYERDVTVLAFSHGGALIEASVGVQKFIFKPAALGRLTKGFVSHPGHSRKRASARTAAKRTRARSAVRRRQRKTTTSLRRS